MEEEEKTVQQQIDELAEWLQDNDTDHPEYAEKFAELERLEGQSTFYTEMED